KLRCPSGLRLAERGPAHTLGVSIDVAVDREAEGVYAICTVAHLRERNSKLRGPAERIDSRRDVPHRVPRAVLVAVVVDRLIDLHSGRVHSELVARSPIVIRVDEQPDHVRRRERVASLEQANDAVRMWIECAYKDEEIRGVVGNLRFGAE